MLTFNNQSSRTEGDGWQAVQTVLGSLVRAVTVMVVKTSLKSWLDDSLSEAMGFPDISEITQYVLSFESQAEQVAYLKEILNPANPRHVQLIADFKVQSSPQTGLVAPGGVLKAYKKAQEPEEYVPQKSKGKKGGANPEPATPGPKGKTKYVSLYSKDGVAQDSILRNGRHTCECQTLKHALVNNCIQCGRIICAQEGSGPCLFCGSLVCTKDEQEILGRNSKKSDQLLKKLLANPENSTPLASRATDDSSALAEKRKNQLLEYDQNSAQRTKVIDDESDYFSVDSNKWLTQDQRQKLKKREDQIREKRHGSRLDRKITFDFAGRKVVEEESGIGDYDPAQDEIVSAIMKSDHSNSVFVEQIHKKTLTDGDGVVNPNISISRPMHVDHGKDAKQHPVVKVDTTEGESKTRRLQDKALQEMSDEGFCMTMHQPYASLLVAGIKRDEGRTWYSAHRGRLWIHAAARAPTEVEINEIHDMYKMYHGKENIQFPSCYPTSCLLGSVDVGEVLSQEDYREKNPGGESNSPFVFVCSNPQELLVKFPMSGKHKIYKLEHPTHQSARKSVKKAPVDI